VAAWYRECVGWMLPLILGLIVTSTAAAGNVIAGAPAECREIQMVADGSVSGIEGRVTIRPVRPVERRGASNEGAYQAKIRVLDASGREVAMVESDATGRFRVPLPPGSYVLRPESPGRYPRASEQHVVVRPGDMTDVTIVYDSGMR
jgi:carboxypeptidase family protein